MDKVRLVVRYAICELTSPLNYTLALIIGVTINHFQGLGIFASPVPFIVPVIVQTISKASVKMANRQTNLLAKLPEHRQDPTFVIDGRGAIIAMAGKTRSIFVQHGITTMSQLLNEATMSLLDELKQEGYVEAKPYIGLLENSYSLKGIWQEECGMIWLTSIKNSDEPATRIAI